MRDHVVSCGASAVRNLGAGRFRVGPTLLVALVAFLWAVSFGAVRDFVWADVRKGLLDVGGFSRVTRGVIWLGFGLLLAMVAALLFNDVWRAQSQLFPLARDMPGRGMLLPAALAPATLFIISIAWSFGLTGVLHAHWAIRMGGVLLYVLSASTWIRQSSGDDSGVTLVGWGAIAAVPIFFLLRSARTPRPGLEFAALLPLVGLTFALLQARGVDTLRQTGVPIVLGDLSLSVQNLSAVIFPLLLRVGFNIVDFTQRAAGWTVAIASDRLPRWAPSMSLLLLLAWRLHDVVRDAAERIAASSLEAELLPFGWALTVPLGVALVWWAVSRSAPSPAAAERRPRGSGPAMTVEDVSAAAGKYALPLIVAWDAPQLAQFLVSLLSQSLVSLVGLDMLVAGALLRGSEREFATTVQASTQPVAQALSSTTLIFTWRVLVDATALVLAAWALRRGRPALALFLGLFGFLDLRSALSRPPGPLAALTSVGAGSPVEFWWVVVFASVAVVWRVRRTLTRTRVERLLFLLLATALLRQTDFIANPFSPFLGFAGVWFIAFGIVWDAVTVGSWANGNSAALPRASRVFLYLGYVLMTVVVVNWALTVHDIQYVGFFTGEIALGGLNVFGRPLLYAIFAATLAQSAGGADVERVRHETRVPSATRPAEA